MKRFLLSFLVFAFSVAASAQFIPHAPAKGGYCLTHAGAWVPIWADQSASALPNGAPAGDLYGLNSNGAWYGLSCDDSGHLTTLPAMTCNASTVPNYTQAVCVKMLTTADLLQFDGTPSTAIPIVSSAGINRLIVPAFGGINANIPASTVPFSFNATLQATEGTADFAANWEFTIAFSSVSIFFMPIPSIVENSETISSYVGGFSLYSATVFNSNGAIATSTLDAAGTGFAVGDTFNDSACDSHATGHVSAISGADPTGPISTYVLDTNGLGCFAVTTGDALVATSGGGTDATIDITAITPPNSTAIMTVPYTVQPVQ